ncbi:hypothetical protein KAW18_10085 [candidate division WOR-3 bacterium]|nr:hypothetical protein [candidate division WOR-3 bacterium]
MVDEIEELEEDFTTEVKTSRARFIRILILIVASVIVITIGLHLGWDKWLIGISLFLFGLVSQAWTSILGLIGTIPGVGHIIVKFLALPLLFLVNGVGNLIAFLAIKMGYKREILDTKILAWAFATGILLGFIIGEIL